MKICANVLMQEISHCGRNDKYADLSSRQSAATKSGGFDNADSEWSHVAWAMLMPCGSRKGGIVKGSLENSE